MLITVITIIAIVLFVLIIGTQAPMMNVRLYEVNPQLFKTIKVTKLSFLFKGTYGKGSIFWDVKEFGVIVPMFVLQLMGYIVEILTVITLATLAILQIHLKIIGTTSLIILVAWMAFCAIYITVLIIISKKRERPTQIPNNEQ